MLNNIPISKKLILILTLMFFVSIATFGSIKYFQSAQEADGAIIDAAGRDRMLSQRAGFYAEQVIFGAIKGEDVTEKKETLKDIIDLHDKSFYALKDGGVAPGIANDKILPPTNDEIMPIVLNTEELWIEYKKNGYIIVNEPTLIDGEVNPAVSDAMEFIEINGPEMLRRNNEMVKAYVQMNQNKQASLNNALVILLAISLIIVAFGYFLAQSIVWSITKPISNLLDATIRVADGDLTVEVTSDSKDEIGQLAGAVNSMVSNLRYLVGEVQQGASKVAATSEEMAASSEEMTAASTQIADTVGEISKGSQNQSFKNQEVSRTMNDMTRTVQEVAINALKAAENTGTTNNQIQQLGNNSQDLLIKMDSIKTVVGDSAEVIKELDEKSKQIGEIVTLITNIADQTNLLALNAAIEAARAGEHGRGFAVVADEVRKLAEDSGHAAQQIADLIHEIQEGTLNAVNSMDRGTEEVNEGALSLNETASEIQQIVACGEELTKMVQEIAAAAEEQSASIEEVTASVEEVSAISEQSAAGTQEASAAVEQQTASMQELANSAQDLSQMADNLQDAVSHFKLDSNEG
ncbi:methyl-accepting chemotaxis protein [Methanolobus sp. ZRKC2]|uniref:methyl-accepting chemotaxis protein n=1 Tax=Methanolobus sp. ZRKC2 TaxID=3125783 RepID=UPI003245173D